MFGRAQRTKEETPRSVLYLVKAKVWDFTTGHPSGPLEDGIKALMVGVDGS